MKSKVNVIPSGHVADMVSLFSNKSNALIVPEPTATEEEQKNGKSVKAKLKKQKKCKTCRVLNDTSRGYLKPTFSSRQRCTLQTA